MFDYFKYIKIVTLKSRFFERKLRKVNSLYQKSKFEEEIKIKVEIGCKKKKTKKRGSDAANSEMEK